MRLLLALLLVASIGACPTLAAKSPPYRVPASWQRDDAAVARFDTLETRVSSAAGFAYLDSATTAARRRGDRLLLMRLLLKRGGTLAYRGEVASGEPDLIEARALAEAIRDTLGQILSIQYRAYPLLLAANFKVSTPLWQRMLVLSRASDDPSHEGWARMGLAYTDREHGNIKAAREGYRRVLQLMTRAGDDVGLQQGRLGLARIAHDTGDLELARTLQLDLLDAARASRNRITEAQVLNNLGSIEAQVGNPAAAEDYFRRSSDIYRELRMVGESFTPRYNRSVMLTYLGRVQEAALQCDSLSIAALRLGNRENWAMAQAQLAEIRGLQDRRPEAMVILRGVLARGDSLGLAERAVAARGLLAALLKSQRREETIALADSMTRATPVDLRAHYARAFNVPAAQALQELGRPRQALVRLGGNDPDAAVLGENMEAQDWVIRSRCYRALGRPDSALVAMRRAIETLDRRRTRSQGIEWRASRGATLGVHLVEYAQCVLEAPSTGPVAGRPSRAYDAMLPYKGRTVAEHIRAASASDTSTRIARARASLASLQRTVLRPGDVLLDYYCGYDRTLLFAVTRSSLRMIELPGRDELYRRVRRLTGALEPAIDPAARDLALRGAAKLLLGGAEADVASCRRLLVSPDGSIAGVPFALLPLAGGEPLLVGREVVSVPSMALLVSPAPRPARGTGQALLALAGEQSASGAALGGAAAEVRWLAREFTGVDARWNGRMRSAAEFGQQLANYDALHIAAHTAIDQDNPWNSGVLLGVASNPQAYLRASAVARLTLPAQVCVLSSCTTAGTLWTSGEGVLGLSAAFLNAGVPSVVATLWPIEDRVAVRFTQEFYTALASGQTAAAALRSAQLALRARPGTRNPIEWAGYVLVGNPDTPVKLTRAQGAARAPAVQVGGAAR